MVNKCEVYGLRPGYISKSKKENKTVGLSSFSFPFNKPDLMKTWTKFVNPKLVPNFKFCDLHKAI